MICFLKGLFEPKPKKYLSNFSDRATGPYGPKTSTSWNRNGPIESKVIVTLIWNFNMFTRFKFANQACLMFKARASRGPRTEKGHLTKYLNYLIFYQSQLKFSKFFLISLVKGSFSQSLMHFVCTFQKLCLVFV